MTEPPQATGRRELKPYLLLIAPAALIAILPLVLYGCSCGHDFDFHLLSWMEAARQFNHGTLHPHWAFTPAYNAGEPRFVFYPPLSWYLGGLLGVVLTHLPGVSGDAAWNAVPVLFTWIALTASGLTLYRLARGYASANAAMLAAVLYLANPYMLFTAYERTAYAELLAAAWIPLLFEAILRDEVTVSGIALPVALLWLTNAPAAVMGSYALALLALLRTAAIYRDSRLGSLQLAARAAAGFVLGIGLAAVYIVPAEYERRFVQIAMATIAGMRIDENFLFVHTGTSSDAVLHDQVLRTASWIAVALLAATAAALAVAWIRIRRNRPWAADFPFLPLWTLAVAIGFLLTPVSLPLWKLAPQAAFLQFSWRLLALLAPVLALAVAAAAARLRVSAAPLAALCMLLVLLLSAPAYRAFEQPCDAEDTASARLASFHSPAGTEPTDEYTPVTADNDSLSPGDPPYWLAPNPESPPPSGVASGPAPMHLAVTSPRAQEIILNLRDYPEWRVTLDGALDPAREPRPDGLIAFPIPAGVSRIDIKYAHTLDETIGDGISLLSLAVMIPLFLKAGAGNAERRRTGKS